ncbi:MAG: hypothetical protein WD738_01460 [Pirellulales bacterium]
MEPTIHRLKPAEKRNSDLIVGRAYEILDAHTHFRGRAARFEFVCREDVLVVRGAVATFYLKQLLQRVLKDVDGIRVVDNQVTVATMGTRL